MTFSQRLVVLATVAGGLVARPAHGQLVVNDPLNTAQAIALVQKIAPRMRHDQTIVINLSGRGDKDCQEVARLLENRTSSH